MSVHPVPETLPLPVYPVGHVHTTSPLVEPSGVGSLHVAFATQGLGVAAHSSVAATHLPLMTEDPEPHVQSRPLKQPGSFVHAAHIVASVPQASFWPTHAPALLHLPVWSHETRPSSHAPFTLVGCAWHAPFTHVPTLQSLLSDEQFFGVLTQTPAWHTSSVHALLSEHVAVLLSLC